MFFSFLFPSGVLAYLVAKPVAVSAFLVLSAYSWCASLWLSTSFLFIKLFPPRGCPGPNSRKSGSVFWNGVSFLRSLLIKIKKENKKKQIKIVRRSSNEASFICYLDISSLFVDDSCYVWFYWPPEPVGTLSPMNSGALSFVLFGSHNYPLERATFGLILILYSFLVYLESLGISLP